MSLDTKVKNLIINTNMTKEQYEAIDDKSNQLFFVEDSSVVDVPAPEENKSGYLHTDGTNLTWKEIESGDYLPLSGGTMTGPINIYQENTNYQKRSIFTTIVKPTDTAASGNLFEIKQDQSSVYVPGFKVTGNIAPNTDESVDFGNASYHFKNVFTKYINAGRDDGPNYATDLYNITVPVKKGTMALLEDIPESTQLETLPVASADNLNKIYQYVGETTSDYTQGHFYKSIKTTTENIVSSGYTLDAETKIVVNVRSDQFLSRNPVFADPSTSNTPFPAWRADYSDTGFWNVWTQTPNISISETELTNIWGISIVDENGSPYTPVAGDSITIMQQEEINYHWEEINFSEDCLPLGGGTLTGPLDISGAILSSHYDNELKIGLVGVDEIITMNLASGSIISVTDSGSLGSGEHKWKTVYTTKLNNGADLALPTEGGTLARLEDIDTVVGDISTALTAILGE